MSIGSEKTDSELTALARDGDETAFREILGRYRFRIMAICVRMLKNQTEAEEAAQDSFVKIYLHLSDYDPNRSFAPWAAGIAINECRDRLRARSRFKRIFRETPEGEIERSHQSSGEDSENRERLETVEKVIQQLPEKLKEVLILKAYGEYSYEEIADALRIRTGTVMSRLFRAREKLTEALKKGNLL